MESNKVKGLIFPVGGEAQAFLADRDRPYRDIREAVQGEYDELGATFADVDIYVNAAGADSLLPNRAINPDAFMDDSGFLSEKSLIVGTNDGKPFSLIFGNIVALSRDETGELIDMPADIETELKESLSDPLDGYDLRFREAFGRYQNWDLGPKPSPGRQDRRLEPTGILLSCEQDHECTGYPRKGIETPSQGIRPPLQRV